jgi:hypothetical protein
MVSDIVNDPWIDVRLYVFDVQSSELQSISRKLANHANLMHWSLFKEKTKNGQFDLYISPNKKLLSPVELREAYLEILKTVKKISEEFKIQPKGAIIVQTVDESNPIAKKNREIMRIFQKILVVRYKLIDRITLEDTDFYLANFIFRSSLYFDFEPKPFRKFLNKIFKSLDNQSRDAVRTQLRQMCGLKSD